MNAIIEVGYRYLAMSYWYVASSFDCIIVSTRQYSNNITNQYQRSHLPRNVSSTGGSIHNICVALVAITFENPPTKSMLAYLTKQ